MPFPLGGLTRCSGMDLGFYVFSLPFYELIRDWALLIIFLSAAAAAAIYLLRGDIVYQQTGFPVLSAAVIRHLSALLALFFLVKAGGYILQRYDLLTSNNGIVFGAAYTDVHLRLPLLIALAAVSLIAAVGCVYNIWLAGIRLPIAAAVLVFAVSIVQTIVPGLFQSYWVKPDELKLESRYIASNIEFTRYGFGLDNITSAPFPAKGKLTPEVVAANQATIQNIRWWDPRPLLDTYRQLQEIRLYYDFHDIDVDRYVIEGSYRQVLLSARELNQSKLPADAQTWINQRFKFTHGNGIAMNPVNRFDNEGLPVFYVKDIPPVGPPELKIDRPEIYFGEETRNYVVVGGDTKEFDYAQGQENVYNVYQGRDGVSLGSLWRRALFAWSFGDFKLLISDNVTASSKILFRRLIQERIRTNRALSPSRSRSLSGRQRRALDLVAGRLHDQRLTAVLSAQPSRQHQLYTQLGEDRGRCLRRQSGFLYRRPERSDRAHLPAHLSDAVSADGIDAGYLAQTHPLPGRSFYHSSQRLRHLSHEGPGGVLQQRRSVELSEGKPQRANRHNAAVLYDYALARGAARRIYLNGADGAQQSR